MTAVPAFVKRFEITSNGQAHKNGVHKQSTNGHAPKKKPAKAAKAAPSKPVSDGRQGNGRFGAGNKFSRGNPFARKLAAARQVFAEVIDEEKLKELADSMFRRALYDPAMAKVLLSYVLGKPQMAPDPDALDIQEWEQLQKYPTMPEFLRTLYDALAPGVASESIVANLPKTVTEQLEHIQEALKEEGRKEDADEPTHLCKDVSALQTKRVYGTIRTPRYPRSPFGG
jgi:hypothetical protein